MNIDYKFLIETAFSAREKAYVPYSHFGVGAALLAKDGTVFSGCNVENAAYTPTSCAERTALFQAIAQGKHEFAAIAVVGGMGTVGDVENYTAPCGVCRQALYEFNDGSLQIIMAKTVEDYQIHTLKELLPFAFTPTSMV